MSPKFINMSGCIHSIVFDKTGTLTEDDIDVEEILPTKMESNEQAHFVEPIKELDRLDVNSKITSCLATCHSLKVLNEKWIGENLEIKLFQAIQWSMHEPSNQRESQSANELTYATVVSSGDEQTSIGVVKQFPFSSNTARMSVIVKQLSSYEQQLEYYIKVTTGIILQNLLNLRNLGCTRSDSKILPPRNRSQ